MYDSDNNRIVIGGTMRNSVCTSSIELTGLGKDRLSQNSHLYWYHINVLDLDVFMFKTAAATQHLMELLTANDARGISEYMFTLALKEAPAIIAARVHKAVEQAKREGMREAKAELRRWLNS